MLSKLAHLLQMASRFDICKADKTLRFLQTSTGYIWVNDMMHLLNYKWYSKMQTIQKYFLKIDMASNSQFMLIFTCEA